MILFKLITSSTKEDIDKFIKRQRAIKIVDKNANIPIFIQQEDTDISKLEKKWKKTLNADVVLISLKKM